MLEDVSIMSDSVCRKCGNSEGRLDGIASECPVTVLSGFGAKYIFSIAMYNIFSQDK